MLRSSPSFTFKATLFATMAFTAACARADTDADTARASAPPPADATPSAASRAPAKDADHEFLRMMSDHHQGLIAMASAAMTKASTDQVKGDARTLRTKQEREQTEMVSLVQSAYGETLEPMVMPANAAMNDTLQRQTGVAYDRTFYRMVIQHHREALRMIGEFLPRLTRPDVRQMAERMRTEQQQEIGELERKLAAL